MPNNKQSGLSMMAVIFVVLAVAALALLGMYLVNSGRLNLPASTTPYQSTLKPSVPADTPEALETELNVSLDEGSDDDLSVVEKDLQGL